MDDILDSSCTRETQKFSSAKINLPVRNVIINIKKLKKTINE